MTNAVTTLAPWSVIIPWRHVSSTNLNTVRTTNIKAWTLTSHANDKKNCLFLFIFILMIIPPPPWGAFVIG